MEISYNWLKDYIKLDLEPEKLAGIFNSIGLEVDSVRTEEEIPGGLEGVKVAKVLECVPHPNSDHLHITKVDCGEGDPLQIVCGAPNVAAGEKVMLATLNTKLTFSNGEEIKIKKSKIRGVESFGMLCAEDELGVGEDHAGIMVLPEDSIVGTAARDYFHLKTDTIFTIELTANRIDAASHIGVARDLSAYVQAHDIGEAYCMPSVDGFKIDSTGSADAVKIEVRAKEACPRYSGLTIRNVTVAESPDWLKTKLRAVGLRPINNIVDISNFILMELGQPLHCFDADKIKGGKIIVDFCKDGTKFKTLDEMERTLSDKDLMINDVEKPLCMAGVFGGLDSGVKEGTRNIFIESAYFNPVVIRKTSKRHALQTDASFRYERGCDPMITIYALKRAALLVKELAGGEITGEIVDEVSAIIEKKVVDLDYARMCKLIGKNIGNNTIRNILGYLEMEFVSETSGRAVVKVPTYRVDVYRECDVVEDVLRIYGYDNVEIPSRVTASVNTSVRPDPERVKSLASEFLASNGFMEIMNNSLTKSSYYTDLKTFPEKNCVRIINPLSSDLNVMRQTLILNGLEVIQYNINRQSPDLKLFEFGNVYKYDPDYVPAGTAVNGESAGNNEAFSSGPQYGANGGLLHKSAELEKYSEDFKLSMFITGNGISRWRNKTSGGDFFSLKGYVQLLFRKFGVDISSSSLEYSSAPADIFSQGLCYKTNGKELAVIGEISPSLLRKFGIKQNVFAAEISWKLIYKAVRKHKTHFTELPKFPEVRRDLALLLDENIKFDDIRNLAYETEKKILKNVDLFDVYEGDKIPAGKKQYAISFVLQDTRKTLTDAAVDSIMKKLFNTFSQKLGAQLR
ncbi:MAG: phenylalanine--tRNA ligase subunit beta [Bacteroidales bacterium]|nr:phenylalanine--tRNA ligase subunit beta [Bacteroidales bacterium]